MLNRTMTRPLATSTLLMLLAACGEGGDHNAKQAVSASPQAPIASAPHPDTLSPNPDLSSAGTERAEATTAHWTYSQPSTNKASSATASSSTSQPPPTQSILASPTTDAIPPSTAQPAYSPTPVSVEAPIVSATGVRGDVLLAMLEQHECGAETERSTSYNGGLTHTDTPAVHFYASLAGASNYFVDPNDWEPSETFAPRECRGYFYHPAPNGAYVHTVKTEPYYFRFRDKPIYGESWLKRGFNQLIVSYTISIRDETFEIGPKVSVETKLDNDFKRSANGSFDPSVRIDSRTDKHYFDRIPLLTLRRKSEVPYGTLRSWRNKNNGSFTRLMLVKSDIVQQTKLCTHVELPLVKRLVCTVWHVPATWQWGQELKYVDGYIVDDRSVYPGESGFLYWRNRMYERFNWGYR